MTDQEFASWGQKEWALRKTEMASVRSDVELKQVQQACKTRREAVGLNAGQAAKAVKVAQRIERGESLQFAMR